MPRSGRRWCRCRARSAARPRRCGAGFGRPRSTPARDLASRPTWLLGWKNSRARFASSGRRARSSTRPALILLSRRQEAGGSVTAGGEVRRPRRGGARPPVAEVIAVMGEHREEFGARPMCRVLTIAPATWHAHAARQARPDQRSKRAKADEQLCAAILRVHAETFGVYGARPRRSSGRRRCAVGSRDLLARDGLAAAPAGGRRRRP